MTLSRRRAVSTYLETFVLIAVAAGGSTAVYSAMAGYVGSARGADFVLTGVEMRQGTYAALERVTVTNTGTTQLGALTVTTSISSSPQYCVNLASGSTGGAVDFASPPPACGRGTVADPASITIVPSPAVGPGASVVLSVIIYSPTEFQTGAEYGMVVSASGAAEQVSVVAVPG